jgi:GxxExxY protein
MNVQVQNPIPPAVEATVKACIGAAIVVHRELGPGYREVIYRRAYCLELDSRGIRFECEKAVLVKYRDWLIPGQRLDLVVDDSVIIEIKSVPRLLRRHERQILSYLKTTGYRVRLLMNFDAKLLRDGLKRKVL